MAEYSAIYDTAIDRIRSCYATCGPAEQALMRKILQEMADKGYSVTLEQTWLADFSEIPVGIDQFLNDENYLGRATNGGESVFPYWRQTFKDIFDAGNRYNEIILSGATRIGKTSTAITILAYMLYRLMLYRDPHKYFSQKPTARFTFVFANLTKELATGVAFFEFNSTIKESPWFLDRGKMSKSEANPIYLPAGDKINILPCSDAAHALGMQVFCLKGDTKILTVDGIKRIEDCARTLQYVFQYDGVSFIRTQARVELTKYVCSTIRVELEDGTIFEGTPDHRVMLIDGNYKELVDLSSSDIMLSPDVNGGVRVNLTQKVPYSIPIPVYDVIDVQPNHNFIIVGSNCLLVSHNCALMDETNFAKAGVKDIGKAKANMKNLYDTINARISGTFRVGGEVYGKLVASSSKNQDNDFLSDHIDKQQRAGNDHLYLVDEPQWKILPKSKFSDKTFHFTVGDRYKKGFVIPEENDDEEHRAEYEKQGYKVIEAPAELRKNFLADYDISLRDIAGISVAGAMGFITQESITPCVSQERQNPFFEDVLVIGSDDMLEISDFYHDDIVPQELKYQQLNIHLDLAETHNRTGIVGCCVCGNKVIETQEGKKVALPFIKQVFSVAIEAPRGGRMSFQKVINFVVWLKQHYYNVGTISTDQYQSDFLRETLSQQGFKTAKFAVNMEQFIALKNLLIDQRVELVKNALQEDELISTQRINNKISHPEDEGGGHGDVADAFAGSVYSLVSEQITARPPAKNVAAIAAAVNAGRGRSANPMSSSKTIVTPSFGNNSQKKFPTRFPKLT